jgi:hypothetical protein
MDARTATLGVGSPVIDSPPVDSLAVAALARAVAVAGFSLLALGGVVILTRRLSGALAAPLSFGTLLACACLLAAAALVFRVAFHPPARSRERWGEYLFCALPSGVLLLWALGLSAPGTGGGLVALWGVLLLEEGWSWGQLRRRMPVAPRLESKASNLGELPLSAVTETGQSLTESESLAEADEPDEAIFQQVVRRRESDGSETIAGWLRAEVPAAARHATAHVAICPPFAGLPQCFAEQMDGPPAQIKVAQILPHGVRFEIKLDEPGDEAADVLVEFSIQYGGTEKQNVGHALA